MISILILTLNEENNIGACIDSVSWSDDIVVLDSFSKDNTIKISRKKGARVLKHNFVDFAVQQNWALKNIKFKNRWVFYLDADERMTKALHDELEMVISDPTLDRCAYYCERKNYFMGRWIKNSFPPVPLMRFFIPGKVKFIRVGHAPVPSFAGPFGYLRERFDHYNFNKGFSEWFEKHNRYSQWEAIEGANILEGSVIQSSVFSAGPTARRAMLKRLRYKWLPFGPWMKFMYLYFFKNGFFDGYPGFLYCMLQAIYEFQIDLKIEEIRRRKNGLAL